MSTTITTVDQALAISLVRLYMDMEREGRDGVSSIPTAHKINQLIADFRAAAVTAALRDVRAAVDALGDAAFNAVGHVGAANYRERQLEAQAWIANARDVVEQLLR